MPPASEFQKILQITRYAVKDADRVGVPLGTGLGPLFGGMATVSSVWLSYKLIDCWFRGYKRKVVMDWYHTVYCLRLGRDVD